MEEKPRRQKQEKGSYSLLSPFRHLYPLERQNKHSLLRLVQRLCILFVLCGLDVLFDLVQLVLLSSLKTEVHNPQTDFSRLCKLLPMEMMSIKIVIWSKRRIFLNKIIRSVNLKCQDALLKLPL